MIFLKANNFNVFSAANTVKKVFFDVDCLSSHTDVKRGRLGSSKCLGAPKQFDLCQQALLKAAEQVRLLQLCYQQVPTGL